MEMEVTYPIMKTKVRNRLFFSIYFLVFIGLTLNVYSESSKDIHVWEMQELTFTAENTYDNAYTDVMVWVDLTGPDFNKRIYGFWDGGQIFHLRLVATSPGTWTWKR